LTRAESFGFGDDEASVLGDIKRERRIAVSVEEGRGGVDCDKEGGETHRVIVF
jgi:hypothetical protein